MRTVHAALQTHLGQSVTTTCRLLKIQTKKGDLFGITTLDKSIEYDDGWRFDGPIVYVAANGFDPTDQSSDVSYSVGNSEATALLSDDIPGITEQMVLAGELDGAEWKAYLITYNDLTTGHHVLLDAGDLGEVRTKYGMVWISELLSYIVRLRQPIGSVWSRKCRAIFGTPADSQTGCGVEIDGLWSSGTVTSVGEEDEETDIMFGGDAIPAGLPARLQFLTGDNAGRTFSIEEIDSLSITLSEGTNLPIQIGDTYRVREDCGKRYQEDCIGRWNNGLNFKGEPLIPTGDAMASSIPGGQLPGGGGFSGTAQEEEP
jgi:uncharacterized phage protein (TIGR02218 family)